MEKPVSFPAQQNNALIPKGRIAPETAQQHQSLLMPTIILSIVGITLIAIAFAFHDLVPIWDGQLYYFRCIVPAVSAPQFNLLNFRCYEHSSLAYALLLSASQWISPNNLLLIYLTNVALIVISAIALFKILTFIKPDIYQWEALLASVQFAFSPVYLAHAFHINLDFGLVCFFVPYLYFLLRKKYWIAALFATAMVFTKETGVPLFFGTAALYLLVSTIRKNWKLRLIELKKMIPLFGPLLLLSLYLLTLFVSGRPLWWTPPYASLTEQLLKINPLHPEITSALFDIYVLNFHWIMTTFVLIFFVALIFKRSIIYQSNEVIFLFLLLLFTTYLSSRVMILNDPRYVLITLPVLIIMFFIAITSLFRSQSLRLILLFLTILLCAISNVITIDPLSKSIAGTLDFGQHPILRMNKWTPFSRDSFVYNLEFTNFYYVMKKIRDDIPSKYSWFLVGNLGTSNFWFPDDDTSHANGMTGILAEMFSPKKPYVAMLGTPDLKQIEIKNKKTDDHLYFVAFPNFKNKNNLDFLSAKYKLLSAKEYENHGYALTLYTFSATPLSSK